MEHGWNWILWPSNLMLIDFMLNWALFIFSLFHILERWNLDQIESRDLWIFVHSHDRGMKPGSNWISWPVNLMLTDFTPYWALFLFSLFHMKEGSKKWQGMCHLDDTALSSFCFVLFWFVLCFFFCFCFLFCFCLFVCLIDYFNHLVQAWNWFQKEPPREIKWKINIFVELLIIMQFICNLYL